jgi:hypothetical protein
MKPSQQHYATSQMNLVGATALLDKSKATIYAQRCADNAHSDIWELSLHWGHYRACIRSELLSGTYPLSPVQVFGSRDGHRNNHSFSRWSAQDATVPKSWHKMIPPGWAYARFMDDWVVLTRTCRKEWKLKERQVVKNMHAIVHGLKLRLALKKTFIGRISKGFDFLGYRFGATNHR